MVAGRAPRAPARCLGRDRAGAHDVDRDGVRIGRRRTLRHSAPNDGPRLRRHRDEVVDILLVHGAIQRVGRGHGADQDQHDEAHAFLAVVRSMREAHARAGQHQQSANPQGRRLVALGLLVERRDAG